MDDPGVKIPGYYSTDEETYYVTLSGVVYLVGSIETDGAVWEPCEALPPETEPSIFDTDLAEEAERTRKERGIE